MFPGGAVVKKKKKSACQCRRCKRFEFNPWVGKIPWNRKWQTTPVFLPRKFHGQSTLVVYSPWGLKESDMTEQLSTQTVFLHKKRKKESESLSCVWLFATPWTVAYQASLSMGFSRQGYWTGLPFPSLGDLPDPVIEHGSPNITGGCFTLWATREALVGSIYFSL